MRIIGPPTASRDFVAAAAANVLKADVRFYRDMFPALWDESLRGGVDPVGVVAQSHKETGGGRFPGNVKPWFFNTAGIKVRDDAEVMRLLGTTNVNHPLVHAQFASWQVGARAHVQHLRAYAGWPIPAGDLIVDPRYALVAGHALENFEDLSGKWAVPGINYGPEIVAIARRLQGLA